MAQLVKRWTPVVRDRVRVGPALSMCFLTGIVRGSGGGGGTLRPVEVSRVTRTETGFDEHAEAIQRRTIHPIMKTSNVNMSEGVPKPTPAPCQRLYSIMLAPPLVYKSLSYQRCVAEGVRWAAVVVDAGSRTVMFEIATVQ